MSFFDDADDVAVIALWIIAIGFVILAIDKTTKLNDDNQSELLPPVPPPSPNASNDLAEDEQYNQIQKQLQQLGNGLSELKKKLSN